MALVIEMLALVSPIFLTIGLGQLIARAKVVQDAFWEDAGRLFYWVGLPLLIFHKVAQVDLVHALDAGQMAGATLGFCVLFLLGWQTSLPLGLSAPKRGSFLQAAIRGNMSYIGLSVVLLAYGEAGVAAASVVFGLLVGVLNVLSLLAILVPQGRAMVHGPRFWLVQLGGNPFIIAAVLGALWSLLGIPLPGPMDATLGIVGRMTLPLALLTIGAEFRMNDFGGDVPAVGLATVLKLFAAPAIVGVFSWILGARGLPLEVVVILAAAPTSSAGYVLAQALGADRTLARTTVVSTTVCAVISLTMVLTVLKLMA